MSEENMNSENTANSEETPKNEVISNERAMRKCPFCAELILVDAIKCRHCGEFLDGSRRNATPLNRPRVEGADGDTEEFLFITKPSLLAGLWTYVKTLLILAVAIGIMIIPLSDWLVDKRVGSYVFTSERVATVSLVRNLIAAAIMAFGILLSVLRIAQLKATTYEVNPDRIEWARGIFSRKIDNTDLFRIVDIKLHRSILDCMFGIGTITVMTQDKTDPELELLKIRSPKKVYNALKTSYLEADRKQGVIHVD